MAVLAQGHWLQASISSLPQGHIQILVRRHPPNTAKEVTQGLMLSIPRPTNYISQHESLLACEMAGFQHVLVLAWPSAGFLITDNTQHDVTIVYLWSKSMFTGIAAAAIVSPMPSSVTPCQR
jgi:hypothetical protein